MHEELNEEMEGEEDEEKERLMEEHDVDEEVAERAQELMDEEGLDEDDAIDLASDL